MTLDAILPSSSIHSPLLAQQGTPALPNGLRLGNEQPIHFPSPNHSAAVQPTSKKYRRIAYQAMIDLVPQLPPSLRNTSSYNLAALDGSQLDDDVPMHESSPFAASHNSRGTQSLRRQTLQSLINGVSMNASRLNDEGMQRAINAVSHYVQLHYPQRSHRPRTPPLPT